MSVSVIHYMWDCCFWHDGTKDLHILSLSPGVYVCLCIWLSLSFVVSLFITCLFALRLTFPPNQKVNFDSPILYCEMFQVDQSLSKCLIIYIVPRASSTFFICSIKRRFPTLYIHLLDSSDAPTFSVGLFSGILDWFRLKCHSLMLLTTHIDVLNLGCLGENALPLSHRCLPSYCD